MPGRADATFLKSALILKPAFALVSINIISCSLALCSPSSTETCLRSITRKIELYHLLSAKSVLLPTNIITTSVPRSALTSSIHFAVFKKEVRSIK